MAWKKAYPTDVVKKTVKAMEKHHGTKLSEKDIQSAIQKSSSIKDLSVQLNKKHVKAEKAADLEKTLKQCGF